VRDHSPFVLLLVFFAAFPYAPLASARHVAGEVLLVYNELSPTSSNIAAYYADKRSIANVLAIDCADAALSSDDETISIGDYTASIEEPVRNYLSAHPRINFIVLTKGVPIRIDGGNSGSKDLGSDGNLHPSVDSYLAAIDYASLGDAQLIAITGSGATGFGWLNRYWNSTAAFSHDAFGGYLVTRLDGYTEADAIALVDRSVAADSAIALHGSVLLDIQPDFGIDDKTVQPLPVTGDIEAESPYGSWNGDLARAGDLLETAPAPVDLDITEGFVGNENRLLGYFSWGSNDPDYSDEAYHSLTFAAGAIGDTAVSTSARTFLPTSGGQSLIADLIAQGITGVKGYANEPLLQAIASPSVALDRYFSGMTLAESFYAASRFVGWEDIVVGDPLAAPYAGNTIELPMQASSFDSSAGVGTETCSEGGLDVSNIEDGAYTEYDALDLTGVQAFEARVASPDGGATIAIREDAADGRLLGTCTAPATGDWQVYTDTYCTLTGADGVHDLYLVYSAGLNVQWLALATGGSRYVSTLPAPWFEADIGAVTARGSSIYSRATGNLTLVGSGADVGGPADAFHFIYASESGGQIQARVSTLAAIDDTAKAGVMFRASLDAGSPEVSLLVTPAGALGLQWRSTEGSDTEQVIVPAAVPVWVRIDRQQAGGSDVFAATYSDDGSTWHAAGSPVALASSVAGLAGFVATSGTGNANAATLDHLAIGNAPDRVFRDGFDAQ
jgi:uncharacterized protein (TIGR03790 family)